MEAGKLDKKIEIHEYSAQNDGLGGRNRILKLKCTAWAEFLKPRFYSSNIQGAPSILVTQQIRIRHTSTDIKRNMLVIYKQSKYQIIFVEEKKDELILTCQEVEK